MKDISAICIGGAFHGDTWSRKVREDYDLHLTGSPFGWDIGQFYRFEPDFEPGLHLLVAKKWTYHSVRREIIRMREKGELL